MNLKSYFLGANTSHGFYSLFNELYNPDEECEMYLIKGGPGTGKSSIMKRVAEQAEKNNFTAIRIPCSSDPFSLDAVIIPELKVSVADATSPHIINPVYPGICEHTIELGNYWNKSKLKANSSVIKELTKNNSDAHKRCIRYLKAAAVIDTEINDIILNICDKDKIKRFTNRLINTELKDLTTGKSNNIFLSTVTPFGIVVQYESLFSAYNKIITIDDKYSCISNIIIKNLSDYCNNNKYNHTLCLCPINPVKKTDHILFSNGTAVFTSNTYHPMINKSYKTIHAERFINKDELVKYNNRLKFLNKTKLEMTGEAVRSLEEAKQLHDLLESYYIAAMDFSKVSEITDKLINDIFI